MTDHEALTLSHAEALAAADAIDVVQEQLAVLAAPEDHPSLAAALRRAAAYARIAAFHIELAALIARPAPRPEWGSCDAAADQGAIRVGSAEKIWLTRN